MSRDMISAIGWTAFAKINVMASNAVAPALRQVDTFIYHLQRNVLKRCLLERTTSAQTPPLVLLLVHRPYTCCTVTPFPACCALALNSILATIHTLLTETETHSWMTLNDNPPNGTLVPCPSRTFMGGK